MSDNNPYSAVVTGIPSGDEFLIARGEEAEEAWDVVLNIGKNNGISKNSIFLIFALGPELLDPETGESLGHIEVVRGQGRVTHLQEKMCTVRSARTRTKYYPKNALSAFTSTDSEIREVAAPFGKICVGDFARLIG